MVVAVQDVQDVQEVGHQADHHQKVKVDLQVAQAVKVVVVKAEAQKVLVKVVHVQAHQVGHQVLHQVVQVQKAVAVEDQDQVEKLVEEDQVEQGVQVV